MDNVNFWRVPISLFFSASKPLFMPWTPALGASSETYGETWIWGWEDEPTAEGLERVRALEHMAVVASSGANLQ